MTTVQVVRVGLWTRRKKNCVPGYHVTVSGSNDYPADEKKEELGLSLSLDNHFR